MITSAANPRLKNLRELIREPRGADVFAVEGVRALEEAVRAGVQVEAVFYSAKLEDTPRGLTLLDSLVQRGAEKVHVAEAVLDRTSATRQSQGVVAVIKKPTWSVEDLVREKKPVFVLDGVRDPGNAGTILRIADAFAFGGLVWSPDSVSPYNDKVVRSAMGSLFRLPFLLGEPDEIVRSLKSAGYRVFSADAHGGTSLRQFTPDGPVAVMLGNEAHGIRPETAQLADGTLRIETPGEAESLNVAVSAGILAYALAR